jgi:hypothetical protein
MSAAVGAALLPVLTGIIGNEASRGDREAAKDQIRSIQNYYDQIKLPDIEQEKLALEEFKAGQMLNPEQQQIRQLSMQDELQNINLDPRLRQTQMNSLDTLSKIAGSGFTPDELNAMQQQRDAREGDLTSKLKQLQQNQEMRGVANSDMALAQRMMEAQGSANRGAQEARDMQAQAFRRSLDAITQSGNLAGNIEGTDYARGADLASALRGRETTNLQNQVNIEGNNVDRFNRALETNVGRVNLTGDKNVALRNDQQQFNRGLQDRDFQRRLQLGSAKSGAATNAANMYNDQASRTAGQWAGAGAGISSGLLALGSDKKKTTPTDERA